MASSTSTPVMSYADFGAWYDEHRTAVLDPALEAASVALDALLADALSTRDLTRIRRSSGRVKSKRRAWRKLQRESRNSTSLAADDAPGLIHDLVGLRITCTNVRDIDMVQAVLETLPRSGTGRGLRLDAASERDYVSEPKESGYRGWHINLTIDLDHEPEPVTCELQVRTLLQDSWGELTHEDTYSKDGELPPLVEVLSKRMADLFATLDDIAEDLRTELDRIDEAVVAKGVTDVSPDSDSAGLPATGQAADAASLLRDRWTRIDRPTALASLAWELQKEFGAEVSDDWFGYGNFKRFLATALPEGEISTGRQAYLLPAEPEAPQAESDDGPDIPDAAEALRRIDQGFPLLQTEQWGNLFAQLADAWRSVGPIQATSARAVNRLTRSARDRSQASGEPMARRNFDYVAKALLAREGAGEPLDAESIAASFATLTIQRMTDLRILGERNRKGRARVRRWIGDEAS